MTRDDIIRMAREAGMQDVIGSWCQECGCSDDMIERFFHAAYAAGAAAEREKYAEHIRELEDRILELGERDEPR